MHIETPLIYSPHLKAHLKLELLQPSGSFKNRGIGHFCDQKAKEGAKGFVTSSGGNAGLAAAYSARLLSLPITVVIPHSTPSFMLNKIRSEGATVIQKGVDWQEADTYARSLFTDPSICYVSPFDDPLIWTGNATLVHELASCFKPDAIVLSVGGGGLLCGVIQGLQELNWNDVPVYAVETAGAASLHAALAAGRVVHLPKIDTLAKSLGARAVAEEALRLSQSHPVISKIVSDASALRACRAFACDHRMLVEPACGASLSLCYDGDPVLLSHQKIVLIVCGGKF